MFIWIRVNKGFNQWLLQCEIIHRFIDKIVQAQPTEWYLFFIPLDIGLSESVVQNISNLFVVPAKMSDWSESAQTNCKGAAWNSGP